MLPEQPALRIDVISWREGTLRFLDQTLLPGRECYVDTENFTVVADAIGRLAMRGAPLIGVAAGYGMALAARRGADLATAARALRSSRPTAVNLAWAVERVLAAAAPAVDPALAAETEAIRIHEEQIAADLEIGALGAALLDRGASILTHCNAGSLATGGIGSALGIIKTAHWQGKRVRVLVDETRPLLQGARLTAWELARESIPHRIIVDAAAAGLIARGDVQAVVVGADRIAANGDVANKVGTYGLALAAHTHGVPFYVAAPASTIDVTTPDGAAIPIEERSADEVTSFGGAGIAPAASGACNPAFDITPASLISATITERGVLRAPYGEAIKRIAGAVMVAR